MIHALANRMFTDKIAEMDSVCLQHMESRIRMLLADDHTLVLNGLLAMLSQEPDFCIVATARNGQDALDQLSKMQVDIALLDIDMPVMTGLEATRIICKEFNATKVVLLSMHASPSLVKTALEAGASGYLLKTTDLEELRFALRQVAKGKSYFDSALLVAQKSELIPKASDTNSGLSNLTSRETEVLRMIAEGLNNNAIAERLFISPKTVDTHRTNLMRKLHAHNAASLTRIAIEAGLIP